MLIPSPHNLNFLWPQPFPKQQILDSSNPKEFADNNFKFDENGRKFSKWVENTVGKEKLLVMRNMVTSIFSFSNNIFYPSHEKFQFFSQISFLVGKSFQFGQV